MVCVEHAIGSKIVLGAPDGTRRWRGSSLSSLCFAWRWCWSRHQIGAWFSPNVPQACNSFWSYPMVFLGYMVKWNLVSIHLEIVLISMQDRCTVWPKRTIGSSLDAPNCTPTWCGSTRSLFLSI
jgi:hypothetical protein